MKEKAEQWWSYIETEAKRASTTNENKNVKLKVRQTVNVGLVSVNVGLVSQLFLSRLCLKCGN